MIGLIAKVLGFILAVIIAILLVLNVTNAWNPGTLAWTQPDVAPCQQFAKTYYAKDPPLLTEVRWIWSFKAYGWGCYYEFSNFRSGSITPMPK